MRKEKITRTEEVWIADDGMTFRTEKECYDHEQERNDYRVLGGLHSMELEVPFLRYNGMVDTKFYFVRNQDERDAIYRKWVSRYSNHKYINFKSDAKNTDIKIGDWVIRAFDYDDGEREYDGIYTLSFIVEQYSKFFEDVNSITVEGMF